MAGDQPPDRLAEAKGKLLEARSRRIRPGLDDQVIAGWNGMAIRCFAEAGAALKSERYLDAAIQAASFVLDNLIEDGVLMRSWRDGRTSVPGFLDDHTSMATALISLYQRVKPGK